MRTSHASATLTKGIYFPCTAYAGIIRRCAILLIDVAVLMLLIIMLGIANLLFFDEHASKVVVIVWLLLAYVYLVQLERSIGTLGLLVTKTKIVDIYGNQPSLLRMTFRLFLCLFWINSSMLLIDWFWSGGNDKRQTLRDLLSGTYIVRKDQAPAGEGPIRLVYYFLLGFVFVQREVQQLRKIGP
jgi:uncharacterized RDD family membrane protein YckC